MTDRRFFRTIIAIEVLSEEQIPEGMELDSVVREARDGAYSMRPLKHEVQSLSGRQAANALRKQGSDPMFFRLTKGGNDE